MDGLPKITFYDIDHTLTPSTRSWSPATAVTALCLNYRRLPYTRVAISYPDIANLLKSKNVPPGDNKRTPWTLPAIDLTAVDGTVTTTMDSAAIARVLEKLTPASEAHPSLFPLGVDTAESDAEYELVDNTCDEASREVVRFVIPHVPAFLDERGREYFNRTRKEWLGRSLEEMAAANPDSELEAALERGAGKIAALYADYAGREGQGVFFKGRESPAAVDFVVVAVLEWYRCARGKVVEEALEKVDGGRVYKVFDSCKHLLF